ncbi:polyphenol oxidase family protein [Candidatus Saccharibacteria bacterium]|nr:polyphenol oxidase family protein [Candidatus Saccharibacteria bacterium]
MSEVIALSTVADGTMSITSDPTSKVVIQNRIKFLASVGITMQNTTRVKVVYEGEDYCRYKEVNPSQKGDGMLDGNIVTADGLVTCTRNHALFLPLADCVGVVIYDPTHHIMMLSHLGRHSLEQNGGYKSVMFLVNNYGCDPTKLFVWLTPAPGQEKYPLFAFNNRAFKEVVFEQLHAAGINDDNITNDPTDTTKDERYFSHSEFLQGNRSQDGRYAVVAMMKS